MMSENLLTRADVRLGKGRTVVRVPFLVHVEYLPFTVNGKEYEVLTSKIATLGKRTQVRPATPDLVDLPTSNVERAITRLLDVLNARRAEQD